MSRIAAIVSSHVFVTRGSSSALVRTATREHNASEQPTPSRVIVCALPFARVIRLRRGERSRLVLPRDPPKGCRQPP